MVFIFLPKGSLILNENRKLVSPATIALACLTERDLSDSIALHPIVWPLNTAKGGAETIPTAMVLASMDGKLGLSFFPVIFIKHFSVWLCAIIWVPTIIPIVGAALIPPE